MTQSERMRSAADTLEEISALYGYKFPDEASWSAHELRYEAQQVEADTPATDYSNCSDHVYAGEDA